MDAYIIHSTCFSELCRKDEEVAIANLSGIQLPNQRKAKLVFPVCIKSRVRCSLVTSLEQSKEPLVSCTVLIFASQKFTVHFVRLGADSGERGAGWIKNPWLWHIKSVFPLYFANFRE